MRSKDGRERGKVRVEGRIPDEWRPAERSIAICARCGNEVIKKNGFRIYTARGNNSSKLLMHFCPRCYANFLDDYGVSDHSREGKK